VSNSNIEWIFNHLYLEEVYLKEGDKNSGYNPALQKMVPSLVNKWTGFAWVFRFGTFVIPLIKGDCANILTVPATRVHIDQAPQDSPGISKKEDWVFRPVVVKEEIPESIVRLNIPVPASSKKKFKIWIPILGAAILGTTAALLLRKGKAAPIVVPVIEPRTMPPGLPSGPGGIPSDPRSQPPGGG